MSLYRDDINFELTEQGLILAEIDCEVYYNVIRDDNVHIDDTGSHDVEITDIKVRGIFTDKDGNLDYKYITPEQPLYDKIKAYAMENQADLIINAGFML